MCLLVIAVGIQLDDSYPHSNPSPCHTDLLQVPQELGRARAVAPLCGVMERESIVVVGEPGPEMDRPTP